MKIDITGLGYSPRAPSSQSPSCAPSEGGMRIDISGLRPAPAQSDPEEFSYAMLNRQYTDLSGDLVDLETARKCAEEDLAMVGRGDPSAKEHLAFIERQIAETKERLSTVQNGLDDIVLDKIL